MQGCRSWARAWGRARPDRRGRRGPAGSPQGSRRARRRSRPAAARPATARSMGARGCARRAREFDIDVMVSNLERLYERLRRERPPGRTEASCRGTRRMKRGRATVNVLDTATRAGPPARAARRAPGHPAQRRLRYAWQRMRDRARERRLGSRTPTPPVARSGTTPPLARRTGHRHERRVPRDLPQRKHHACVRHHVMLDDLVTQRLALDKALVHRMLTAERLPVPAYVEFDVSDTRARSSSSNAGARRAS